jgi:hypothetical protein
MAMMYPRSHLKTLLVEILLASLLLATTYSALAQDATAAETTPAVNEYPGLATGVLLIGLLALLAVGGVIIARERYQDNQTE